MHDRAIWAGRHTQDQARCGGSAVHDHVVLMYVTEGGTRFEQRGTHDVRAGDMLVVPAGQPHRNLRSAPTTGWGIGFYPSTLELGALLDPVERAAVVHIPAERRAHLEQLCAELARESQEPLAHSELAQKQLLSLVLVDVARAATAVPVTHSFVAGALRFIERECLGPIGLTEVARAVGRSPAHVTTAVKRETGKTVGEWITTARMAAARDRLLGTDELVEIVAERVGYADATHFARMFRREHGTTPARWRRQARARG